MILSSYSFLFLFLPVVLGGFFFLGSKNHRLAGYWLLLASLFSYAFWNVRFLPILLVSIGLNYFCCIRILATEQHKKLWLTAGIAVDLLVLGTFKYANFFIDTISSFTGSQMPTLNLLLPIGISFFTFTQISLLVDAYHGKVKELNPGRYALFVSYFPYIVAGPVLHHDEVFADPHIQQREMVTHWNHPLRADLRLVSSPIKLEKTPVRTDRPPPLLGQHTDEVLQELLQCDAEQLNQLRQQQVI